MAELVAIRSPEGRRGVYRKEVAEEMLKQEGWTRDVADAPTTSEPEPQPEPEPETEPASEVSEPEPNAEATELPSTDSD
jgi:hypothetical protein